MNIPSHLRYDIDGVIDHCKDSNLRNSLESLVSDINTLSNNLPQCEEGFHGKKTNNVIYAIYNSFSKIIGTTPMDRNSLSDILRETEDLINSDYNKSINDKNELQRLIEEERRRQEEERRRQEEERRRAEEERQKLANAKTYK